MCYLAIIMMIVLSSCKQDDSNSSLITKGNLTYDFTFADMAIHFLETGDSTWIGRIADLPATDHILNHAKRYHYNVPKDSKTNLVLSLLTPVEKKKLKLEGFKRNVKFAKEYIAKADLPQQECLNYLPEGFEYDGSLFFTFGYDLGVVYGNNASVNLAHSYYLKNMEETKYYAIHELHHAGFVALKNGKMPSLEISNFKEMATLIEYLSHLEGLGTFTPLEIRTKEGALNIDDDYISIQDSALMKEYEKEYFEIYFHFKNNPEKEITNQDWKKVAVLSDKKRLWYRVGAHMANTIDKKLGREKLTQLIAEPSENFIKTYLEVKD